MLPGTPRNADGTPNLNAPAPVTADGHPDLSGVWAPLLNPVIPDGIVILTGVYPGLDLQAWKAGATPIPMTPWAQAIFDERSRNFSKGNPSSSCLPHGIPEAMMIDNFKIVQHPGVTLILYEEFARFRQIFTDGRRHPSEMNPAWLGYSVGQWERDAFVVDTRGFNDRSWLDFSGHPHSEQLRIIERFRRIDFGHMQLELMFEDPVAFREPWSARLNFQLMADTDLIENVCENEKDSAHIVGRVASDDHPAVSLSIDQLREYEGVYGERRGMTVALIDGRLVFNGAQLLPVSGTDFASTVGNVEFFRDSSGQIERLRWTVLGEGELDLKRRH